MAIFKIVKNPIENSVKVIGVRWKYGDLKLS